MALESKFLHQAYSRELPSDCRLTYLSPSPSAESVNDVYGRRRSADLAKRAGVSAILLVHGTFAGNDALGVVRKLSRIWPDVGRTLRKRNKEWFDWLVKDAGNYTQAYAEQLSVASDQGIHVERFNWSSENHHIGRADGAVGLLHRLGELDEKLPPGSRVQIWAHSHGGNALALLSNLLGGDAEKRRQFFDAGRPYYRWPLIGREDFPVWGEVQRKLDSGWTIADRLDLVTFGTPIRYGWDRRGYRRLLHFVNHKPIGEQPHLAALPQSLDDLLSCRGGDYIQHFGIAGTNARPGLLAWRAGWADRRLNRILQSGVRKRDFWRRIKVGARVPEQGETLLVDYGQAKGKPLEDVFGHAVYTREEWLAFHLSEIVNRLYGG